MGPRLVFTRREFCAIAGSAVAAVAFGNACSRSSGTGRLTAHPRENVKTSATGRVMLGLDQERDAILQLPRNVGQSPLPLFVMLHGATQSADDMFEYLGSTFEDAGVAVLAPNSRDTTWDAISGGGFGGGFGVDVTFLQRALERVFETASIDPARISIGGFSDGASYGLSLGLINGDLFRSLVAFSPGFVIDGAAQGKPHIFISHGTHDHILPIDSCGRRIASSLTARGYDVTFREFDGDHEVPDEIAREGVLWVTGS
ncbi:MAG TPA: PHB depolymerase family esterase [Pyrinomonadaceae bacterium]|nr:PHB depolymerase family esterase [Pyrinomonadaceae bacterium]